MYRDKEGHTRAVRFSAEQLPGNHPIIKASAQAADFEFGGQNYPQESVGTVDHEVLDYAATHPMRRRVCYADRNHAQAIARELNDRLRNEPE